MMDRMLYSSQETVRIWCHASLSRPFLYECWQAKPQSKTVPKITLFQTRLGALTFGLDLFAASEL